MRKKTKHILASAAGLLHIRTEISTDANGAIVKTESSRQEVFLGKGVLKTCSKFTGENPWGNPWSVISILWHGCSHVNLLHIFRTPFSNKTCVWLLLKNKAIKIDCLCCREVNAMLIASAKILERKGSISPCRFYG